MKKNLLQPNQGVANLTIYAPDGAVIGGVAGEWSAPSQKAPGGEWPFWNEEKQESRLGDFKSFVAFLRTFLGSRAMQLATEPAANA